MAGQSAPSVFDFGEEHLVLYKGPTRPCLWPSNPALCLEGLLDALRGGERRALVREGLHGGQRAQEVVLGGLRDTIQIWDYSTRTV